MARQDEQFLAGLCIPHSCYKRIVVGNRQARAVRAEGDVSGHTGVEQREQFFAGRSVPYPCRAIIAACGQVCPVRTEGETGWLGSVAR